MLQWIMRELNWHAALYPGCLVKCSIPQYTCTLEVTIFFHNRCMHRTGCQHNILNKYACNSITALQWLALKVWQLAYFAIQLILM